ncbi:unnamed protein product, partial [Rotaria sp. Silwood1]
CDHASVAFQNAIENLNVETKRIVDNFHPSKWKYRSPGSSSSFIPAHLQTIWSKEDAVRSVLFSLISTQINQQTFSTPSSPRKIRSQSDSSAPNALSSSSILNMYLPTSNEKKIDITTKTTLSVEYHTYIIEKILKGNVVMVVYETGSGSEKMRSSEVDETNNKMLMMNSASTANSNAVADTVPMNEDYKDDQREYEDKRKQ